MQYINPLQILDLTYILDVSEINSEVIKKSKRKLYAEIDLDDKGVYNYYEVNLTKSDCDKAIDELNNKAMIEYYHYLILNDKLNSFLVNGNEKLFESFSFESIYTHQEFLSYISPYFAYQFNRVFLKLFIKNDVQNLNKMFPYIILILPAHYQMAYQGVYNKIETRIIALKEVTNAVQIKSPSFNIDNINNCYFIVENKFPVNLLNNLPKYFNSKVYNVAEAINFLLVAIAGKLQAYDLALKLNEYILQFNVEGISTLSFNKNLVTLKTNIENSKAISTNNSKVDEAGLTKAKFKNIILNLEADIKKVEQEIKAPSQVYENLNSIFSKMLQNKEQRQLDSEIYVPVVFLFTKLAKISFEIHHDTETFMKIYRLLFSLKDKLIEIPEVKSEFILFQQLYDEIIHEQRCKFCDCNNITEEAVIITTVYKPLFEYNLKKASGYQEKKVNISRCSKCQTNHNFGNFIFQITLIGFILFGILLKFFFLNNYNTFFGYLIIALSCILGLILGLIFEKASIKKSRVKPNNFASLNAHPIIISQKKLGWSLIKPQ